MVIASQNGVHLLLPKSGEASVPASSKAVVKSESTICFPRVQHHALMNCIIC